MMTASERWAAFACSASSPPNSATATATSAATLSSTEMSNCADDRAAPGRADVGGDRLRVVADKVTDHDGRALLGQADRGRRADPGAAAGHHHGLVDEPSHASS